MSTISAAIEVTKLDSAPFGVETDYDVRQVKTPEQVQEIKDLLHEHGVVVFHNQSMTDQDQKAFAGQFGKRSRVNIEDQMSATYYINNEDGFGVASSLPWHSDNQYFDYPIRYLMLYGVETTTNGKPIEGGETMMVDVTERMTKAPAELVEKLRNLKVVTDIVDGRGRSVRPGIQAHPETGREYPVLSGLATGGELYGETLSDEDFKALQAEFAAFFYDEEFVLKHKWQNNDLVMWDNVKLQHARNFYDNTQNRTLRRSPVADDRETEAVPFV